MRYDLLQAQACIDWTVSQLPSFEGRLQSWVNANMQIEFRDPDPNGPDNMVVIAEKEPFPLTFNAEFGAYLNTLRSSLDLLATSLAHRYSVPHPDKHYFPVSDSPAKFIAKDFKGKKFIEALPQTPRLKIESVKPYKGGNDKIWFLHHLDVVRKHRRLLFVNVAPMSFSFTGWGFKPVSGGFMRSDGETVIGFTPKGRTQPKMDFICDVAIEEAGFRTLATVALRDFGAAAASIINLFDCP